MRDIKEVLIKVENGELTSKEAVDILRSLSKINECVKYSNKIKIKILDRKGNKKINLPVIPIWFIEKIILFGAKLNNLFYKKQKRIKHRGIKNSICSEKCLFENGNLKVDTNDIKELFSVLRHIPPCKLVEIDDKDAFVEIHLM